MEKEKHVLKYSIQQRPAAGGLVNVAAWKNIGIIVLDCGSAIELAKRLNAKLPDCYHRAYPVFDYEVDWDNIKFICNTADDYINGL